MFKTVLFELCALVRSEKDSSHLGGLSVGDVASELLLHGLDPAAVVWVLGKLGVDLVQSLTGDG